MDETDCHVHGVFASVRLDDDQFASVNPLLAGPVFIKRVFLINPYYFLPRHAPLSGPSNSLGQRSFSRMLATMNHRRPVVGNPPEQRIVQKEHIGTDTERLAYLVPKNQCAISLVLFYLRTDLRYFRRNGDIPQILESACDNCHFNAPCLIYLHVSCRPPPAS